MGFRWCALGILPLAVACKDKPAPTATATATATATTTATASATATTTATAKTTATAVALTPFDAGKTACAHLPPADGGDSLAPPGCALTAKHAFCIDSKGRVTVRDKGGAASRPVAAGRPGSRVAATDFGEHEVVAFLADQKTSEGTMLQAFASIDGAPPMRISDEGAGATSVDVAPRGSTAILAYVDARGAMAPAHARVLSDKGGKVELGKDAVIFLGGAPDPFVAGALGTTKDQAFFVLPIAKDATTFGMAVIRIDDPPKDDEPVTWAMYPSGLDPAPIALTRGVSPIRVARVIPRATGPTAPQAIELGEIQPSGVFRSLGVAVERDHCAYVALEVDPSGALLLEHTDGDSGAVDRFRCAP